MRHLTILYIIGAALLLPHVGMACDFCNCLLGINPYYSTQNTLTVSYLFQRSDHPIAHVHSASSSALSLRKSAPLSLHHINHGGEGDSVPTQESRHTIELAYRHHLTEDVLLTLLVPFSRTKQEKPSSSLTVMGSGDITLLGHYNLRLSESLGTRLMLLIGGGIVVPVGRTDARDAAGTLLDYRLQPGRGAVGFVTTATGILQRESWTFGADAFARWNTKTSAGNRLGHNFAATLAASRELLRDNPSLFALVASVGGRLEYASKDLLAGVPDATSGATVFYLSAGVDAVYDFLRFELRTLVPVHQQRPEGGANERTRFMVGMRLLF
jgi:hypothetical protein